MSASRSEQSRRARVQLLGAELYREQRARLLSIALRNAANRGDAEEALQDAFALFINHFDPSSAAPPRARLTLTLKRRCWALQRARHLNRSAGQERSTGSGEPGFSIDRVVSEASDADQALERAEWLVDARRQLAELKPDERRALVLIAAGFSYAEIARMNRWTTTKVNRSASEGRAVLREAVPS